MSGPRLAFQFNFLGHRYLISGPASLGSVHRSRAIKLILGRVREDVRFRSSLARWARDSKAVWATRDDDGVIAAVARAIEAGTIGVHEIATLPLRLDPIRLPRSTPPPEPISPRLPDDDIVDDNKSLLITACDLIMRPGIGPLRGRYLLRALEGKAVTLRFVSDALDGRVLHEQQLSAGATLDGSHPLEWDGVITRGPDSGKIVPPKASPLRVELEHDASYRDEAPFETRASVHTLELGRVHFHSESAVPPPAGNATELGLIEVVRAVFRFGAEHADKQILIAGHTDTAGTREFNRELSGQRAAVVYALLMGDRDGWAELCAATATVLDTQRFLAWFAVNYEFPNCAPGPLDNDRGPKTRAASKAFRELYNLMFEDALAVDDTPFKQPDWAATHLVYSDWLAVILDVQQDELAQVRARLRWLEPATLGCGEEWPLESIAINGFPSRMNRRIDILFFDESEVPDTSDEQRPGESLYARPNYEAVPIACDPEPNFDGRYFFSI